MLQSLKLLTNGKVDNGKKEQGNTNTFMKRGPQSVHLGALYGYGFGDGSISISPSPDSTYMSSGSMRSF